MRTPPRRARAGAHTHDDADDVVRLRRVLGCPAVFLGSSGCSVTAGDPVVEEVADRAVAMLAGSAGVPVLPLRLISAVRA